MQKKAFHMAHETIMFVNSWIIKIYESKEVHRILQSILIFIILL